MKRNLPVFAILLMETAVLSFKTSYAQLTIPSLKEYQVISRTSSDKADYVVSGTCVSSTNKILLDLTNQDDSSTVGDFSNFDISATVQGTSWNARLQQLPIGGEYKAKFKALNGSGTITDSATIQHILVGEIWLASGQSNMQQVSPSNSDPKHVHVRQLYRGSGPTVGLSADTSRWGNGNITGPGMTFGIEYYKQTGIPVGILLCASGNTSINDWFAPPQRPLFTMMVNLVKSACDFKINGFLWYQGENEDQQDTWALRYFTKFLPFRDSIRVHAKNPELPVLAVQLESWNGGGQWTLPPERWPRWPVIRDRQELIGRADSLSATVPAWDFAGLHIDQQSQGALGIRAAQIAAGTFCGKQIGTGPIFDTAWFQDELKTKIVLRFKNVTGKIISPDDPDHLGFFVMKPKAFDINDSTIFNYGTASKLLVNLKTIKTLDNDKVVIELNTATSDSITIGYGRHIDLINLNPVTDNTGIPLCTFFNRPIAEEPPTNVFKQYQMVPAGSIFISTAKNYGHRMTIQYYHPHTGMINVSIFSVDGRKVTTLYYGSSKAGMHQIPFHRIANRQPASGVYICRLVAEKKVTQCLLPAIR